MSARSVCSGTRPRGTTPACNLDAVQRPALMILIPCAPRRIAFCSPAFMRAEHDALLQLLRDRIGDQLRVTSALRISSMLTCTICTPRSLRSRLEISMFSPFLPMTTPGRALWDGDARVLRRTFDDHLPTEACERRFFK